MIYVQNVTLSIIKDPKNFYFMRDIPIRVVNALYELHLIIEEVRKNYAQSKRCNKTIHISLKN